VQLPIVHSVVPIQEASAQACPGGVMTQEWIDCKEYVLHACAFAPSTSNCEEQALRQYLQVRSRQQQRHVVSVKYRDTPVDLSSGRFEFLDTSRSSFVTGAWYDRQNSYLVIGLRDTYYHHCRMPPAAWTGFRAADSFGRHYNDLIKGDYDCRLGGVPQY
jgi:hypothetical protein